jgi:predicted heme/steroid binding protein
MTDKTISSQFLVGGVVGISLLALYGVKRYFSKKADAEIEIPLLPEAKPRGFTAEQLAEFKGTNGKALLLSVKGTVFEVAPQFYGPGMAYHCFAGTECSRNLAKAIIGDTEANAEWRCLCPYYMKSLDQWEQTFKNKYRIVGWFIPDGEAYVARGKAFPNEPPVSSETPSASADAPGKPLRL